MRGFIGVSGAMISVRVASAIYELKAGALLIFVVDSANIHPLVVTALPRCR